MRDIQRSTLWAMSGRDSRSPRGDWVWSTKVALPPRVLMAASKVRRVRREAFLEEHDHLLGVKGVAEGLRGGP